MPPFSMLRTKKSAKARPRTPPSPGSFYSPARSPAPWAHSSRPSHIPFVARTRTTSDAQDPGSSRTSDAPKHAPSAWSFADSRPPRPSVETVTADAGPHGLALQLDLGPSFEPEIYGEDRSKNLPPTPRRPSDTDSRSRAVAELPGPKRQALPPVPPTDTHRHVPAPIKIPRMHVHAPSIAIERTPAARSPSPSSHHPATSNSTPTTGSSASIYPSPSQQSIISDSAPELVTILRAERASTAVYGVGFGLTLRPSDFAGGLARQDSATLPREGPYTRASIVPANALSPILGGSSTAETSPAPAFTPAPSPSKNPVLRRSVSTDGGLVKSRPETIYGRPETFYLPQNSIHRISEVPSTPRSPEAHPEPMRSPTRIRSKTVTERRDVPARDVYAEGYAQGSRQRALTVDNSPRGANAAPTIKRSRSPSGATTLTHPSRPITPPDAPEIAPPKVNVSHTSSAHVDSESPRVRTMRLQSAPNVGSAPVPAPTSILSKFARSQMGFENFSFLGGRGRSVSDASATASPVYQRERGWTVGSPLSPIIGDGEASPNPSTSPSKTSAGVPVRPARPPSLSLTLDPPGEEPRPKLKHSNSGSSTGSGLGVARVGSRRLRRKRSSPRQAPKALPYSDGLQRSASTSGSIGAHQRAPSITTSSGSQRTTGTQQPTPTSANNSPLGSGPALTLKQRRETVFPSTPRSFSNESVYDSPSSAARSAVPDLLGFVLDGSLLMPLKSPASGNTGSLGRKAHLPIGPRLGAVPVRSETVPLPPTTVAPTPALSAAPKMRQQKSQQPPSPRLQPKQPPSPTFEPIPVRWRGLTMDAAKWTFSSNQLQSIVSRAIKQSAETSSVRLLPLDVLDQEFPTEVDRLEQLRDVLQTKYKAQVRRRRLLMRSLALYIDGHDPPTSKRLMDELEDVGMVCDQLAEDLYLVGDQLAQISRLRDVHHTSALAVALRKINGSYIRARSEVVELQDEKSALEAERDQAWMLAESLERELADARLADAELTGSESRSRVSAARKSSVRQSKMSLRPSLRRSARSSTSGGSMRYHGIVFPRPPSTPAPLADSANTSSEFVPPVPPMPTSSKHLSTFEPSRPESIGVLPVGLYALSPGLAPPPSTMGFNENYSTLSVPTPSATSHDLYTAQSELLNMLGLSYKEYGFRVRPRSYSDGSAPSSPPASPMPGSSLPPSAYGPKGKLLRSTSDQALRRHSSVDRVITVQVPATGGVLEDPAAILAALTLPQD